MTEYGGQRSTGTTTLAGPVNDSALDHPSRVPLRAWWQILRRAWRETQADNISLLAAGVAFFGFLAIFPALLAAISIYGMVADPADVQRQVDAVADVLPSDAQSLIRRQLSNIATTSGSVLSFGLVVAVAGALWTVSTGVRGLITATSIAYDARETRRTLRLRGVAVLLTVVTIVFVLTAIGLVAAVPAAVDAIGFGASGRIATELVRWPLLLCSILVALAVIYWIAPDREASRLRWVSVGSVVAAFWWIVASVGLSVYVETFGRYSATYGSLAGVVVLLLWLYVGAFAALFGAEINAEAERVQADSAAPAQRAEVD